MGRHIDGLHHQTTQVQGPSHRNHLRRDHGDSGLIHKVSNQGTIQGNPHGRTTWTPATGQIGQGPWGTYHDHYRQRQTLHVKLLENYQCSNGNKTQDVHGLSPTDGWPDGMSKSGTRNVPTALHQPYPQQLGTTITSGTTSD